MLTLEYLPDGSEDCPLIRLYGFEAADVVVLRDLCIALADGRIREVSLQSQPWVRVIDGCSLVLRAGGSNRGIVASRVQGEFVMDYTAEGWLEVSEKLAPFINGASGFQWLTNEGEVGALISWNGGW